jgi:MFS family permease
MGPGWARRLPSRRPGQLQPPGPTRSLLPTGHASAISFVNKAKVAIAGAATMFPGAKFPPVPTAASGFGLLRGNPAFRSLWLARAISFVGDSLGLIALILYTVHATGDPRAVAVLLLVGDFLPPFLTPLTAGLSDRFDRKTVMIGCELARGSIFLLIALVRPPVLPLLLLVFAQAVVGQAFQPASRAAVPSLVEDEQLEAANATLGLGTSGLEVLGPVLAAATLPFLGLRGVLLGDAATFAVSALILLGLPALRTEVEEGRRASLGARTREGLTEIWRRPILRAISIGFFLVVVFLGVDDVALVFLARLLGAGDAGTSVLYAGSGVGLLVGLAVLSRWPKLLPALLMLVAGLALSSSGNLLTGIAWAVPVAFLTQAIRGLGNGMNDLGANTAVQRLVPGRLQGRVFGNLYGAIGIAAGMAYLIGGQLVVMFGPRAVFLGAGVGGLVTAAVLALVLRRLAPGYSILDR